ncbi:MAG: capsule-associated protein CAP1 [Claussenomyces sp. TS43310]|nr:MAG: capsule-associated protein CAP1 [Claussenomyces sp. TS43310]
MATHRRASANFPSPSPNKGYHHSTLEDIHPSIHDVDSRPSVGVYLRRLRRKMKSRQFCLLLAAIIFISICLYAFRYPPTISIQPPSSSFPRPKVSPPVQDAKNVPPQVPSDLHPLLNLVTNAQQEFQSLQSKQSRTLAEAVAEYRRRYGLPPPPNFDKWYEFAKQKNVQFIDEYDIIHDSLTPFWALKPATIRARAREVLGYDNVLLGVLIRHGNITKLDGGRDWMQEALMGMTKEFVEYLPDMDLCFNVHDEPRVILPHDDLARLVAKAKVVTMPAAGATENPRNKWSRRPKDMNDGTRIEESFKTRFNRMQHQPTWTHSRISCSPQSPARSLEEDAQDDIESYGVSPLGFIYNHTAFSDICSSPSFASSYGFFTGANSFNIVHDLFPIFSQSKISSYQDIIYPSPWYWFNKVPYNEEQDLEWREKEDKLYWRGSTTGGFSRDGNWRRQHRQHFVQKINEADQAKIMRNVGNEETGANWTVKDVFRPEYQDVFDIKFSHIGQCDPGDCTAQKEFFPLAPVARQQDAWKAKHLLDMDGNAFSGRFYAFLRSRSLVYKIAIFREWHADVVRPWVHYVPLTLRGDDWLECLRWFLGEPEGKVESVSMATAGRDWAAKVLRNEDMEVWLFRLLLEYVVNCLLAQL